MSGSRKSQGRHGVDPYWRCEPESDGGCWIWLWSKQKGYGQMVVDGRVRTIHRLVYESQVGPITDGLWVLHHCGNRACVRPDHLYLGTAKDNSDDMALHGTRWRGGSGGLPDDVVTAVRMLAPHLPRPWQSQMAEMLGVSPSMISAICRGVAYGDVSPGLVENPVAETRLSDEQVAALKSRYTGRFGEQGELAKEFGISSTAVSTILRGLSHPDVLPELSGSMKQYRARHRL